MWVFFVLIGLGIFLSFLRMILGPTSPDRVAALDGANIMVTGLLVLVALVFQNGLYLDIALIYATLSFVETVVLSRYLEAKK